ncbi:conserved hypothetical protein [Beggiatoa sp. PS]|nr:conserved hypothetical protein [Beggiatoa sp. PS]
MNELEYQQTLEKLNQCPCTYEKAILSNRCACEKSQRIYIAEREAVACLSSEAQERCMTLLEQFFDNARFALRQTNLETPQPHAKAMKVQCGGLLGLQAALSAEQPTELKPVENIDALVTQALEEFGDFKQLPYQKIIQFISHYQVRGKRSQK